MKRILLIATGGTIASSESGKGLAPSIDAEKILSYIPQVRSICQLEGLSIMSVDSTNMNPSLITKIAETVADKYSHYDGFVVTHGTDTMGYSAAFLTCMIKNTGKPVVITGSQHSIEEPDTDAKKNLTDAIRFACDGLPGIFAAFDGLIIDGAHLVKVKTKSNDAFESVNYPVIARINQDKIEYNDEIDFKNCRNKAGSKEREGSTLSVEKGFCQDVLILKMFPGIGTEIFDFAKTHYKGVVIEGYGTGGIPDVDNDIVSKIRELVESGIAVVVTTQCMYEGIDLEIYKVGHNLSKCNVINGKDMTTELLVMKLMWALAHFNKLDEIKKYIEDEMQ
ncbi:MAG: asparaginase [Eubacteriales bacterium]|nr:asparaginase [Eubacteriales bacterium]